MDASNLYSFIHSFFHSPELSTCGRDNAYVQQIVPVLFLDIHNDYISLSSLPLAWGQMTELYPRKWGEVVCAC